MCTNLLFFSTRKKTEPQGPKLQEWRWGTKLRSFYLFAWLRSCFKLGPLVSCASPWEQRSLTASRTAAEVAQFLTASLVFLPSTTLHSSIHYQFLQALGCMHCSEEPHRLTCEYSTLPLALHHSFSPPFQLNPRSLSLIIIMMNILLVFWYILQPMSYINLGCFFQLLWQQLVLPMALVDKFWMKKLCRRKKKGWSLNLLIPYPSPVIAACSASS